MELNKEQIEQEIQKLIAERNKFVEDAKIHTAWLNGKLQVWEEWLKKLEELQS